MGINYRLPSADAHRILVAGEVALDRYLGKLLNASHLKLRFKCCI
jgi:hypothetical protein